MLLSGRAEHSELLHRVMFTHAVAQKYIAKPYLFGGRKFHLRLYVLVTSWHPPAAFLYDDGLVFRSRQQYDAQSPSTERDVFSSTSDQVEDLALAKLWQHLGDQSVAWMPTPGPLVSSKDSEVLDPFQSPKHHPQRVLGAGNSCCVVGFAIPVHVLCTGKAYLPFRDRWASEVDIKARIVKLLAETLGTSLLESFGPASRLPARGYDCFDVFGADVMLDSKLRPHLLEINSGPNLWIDQRNAWNQTFIKGAFVHQVALWAYERLQTQQADRAHKMLLNFTRLL